MFPDCILVGDSFVVVIEAKNYLGKIRAKGDVKNTVWVNSRNGEEVDIAACWGNNPYKQAHNYMDAARSLLRSNMSRSKKQECNSISFYQVVVFPDGANLSALEIDLTEYSRITKLKSLVDTIHDLERQTRSYPHKKGDRKFISSEIEDYLRGRPVRKTA